MEPSLEAKRHAELQALGDGASFGTAKDSAVASLRHASLQRLAADDLALATDRAASGSNAAAVDAIAREHDAFYGAAAAPEATRLLRTIFAHPQHFRVSCCWLVNALVSLLLLIVITFVSSGVLAPFNVDIAPLYVAQAQACFALNSGDAAVPSRSLRRAQFLSRAAWALVNDGSCHAMLVGAATAAPIDTEVAFEVVQDYKNPSRVVDNLRGIFMTQCDLLEGSDAVVPASTTTMTAPNASRTTATDADADPSSDRCARLVLLTRQRAVKRFTSFVSRLTVAVDVYVELTYVLHADRPATHVTRTVVVPVRTLSLSSTAAERSSSESFYAAVFPEESFGPTIACAVTCVASLLLIVVVMLLGGGADAAGRRPSTTFAVWLLLVVGIGGAVVSMLFLSASVAPTQGGLVLLVAVAGCNVVLGLAGALRRLHAFVFPPLQFQRAQEVAMLHPRLFSLSLAGTHAAVAPDSSSDAQTVSQRTVNRLRDATARLYRVFFPRSIFLGDLESQQQQQQQTAPLTALDTIDLFLLQVRKERRAAAQATLAQQMLGFGTPDTHFANASSFWRGAAYSLSCAFWILVAAALFSSRDSPNDFNSVVTIARPTSAVERSHAVFSAFHSWGSRWLRPSILIMQCLFAPIGLELLVFFPNVLGSASRIPHTGVAVVVYIIVCLFLTLSPGATGSMVLPTTWSSFWSDTVFGFFANLTAFLSPSFGTNQNKLFAALALCLLVLLFLEIIRDIEFERVEKPLRLFRAAFVQPDGDDDERDAALKALILRPHRGAIDELQHALRRAYERADDAVRRSNDGGDDAIADVFRGAFDAMFSEDAAASVRVSAADRVLQRLPEYEALLVRTQLFHLKRKVEQLAVDVGRGPRSASSDVSIERRSGRCAFETLVHLHLLARTAASFAAAGDSDEPTDAPEAVAADIVWRYEAPTAEVSRAQLEQFFPLLLFDPKFQPYGLRDTDRILSHRVNPHVALLGSDPAGYRYSMPTALQLRADCEYVLLKMQEQAEQQNQQQQLLQELSAVAPEGAATVQETRRSADRSAAEPAQPPSPIRASSLASTAAASPTSTAGEDANVSNERGEAQQQQQQQQRGYGASWQPPSAQQHHQSKKAQTDHGGLERQMHVKLDALSMHVPAAAVGGDAATSAARGRNNYSNHVVAVDLTPKSARASSASASSRITPRGAAAAASSQQRAPAVQEPHTALHNGGGGDDGLVGTPRAAREEAPREEAQSRFSPVRDESEQPPVQHRQFFDDADDERQEARRSSTPPPAPSPPPSPPSQGADEQVVQKQQQPPAPAAVAAASPPSAPRSTAPTVTVTTATGGFYFAPPPRLVAASGGRSSPNAASSPRSPAGRRLLPPAPRGSWNESQRGESLHQMDARRAARDEAEFQRRAQTLRSPTRRDEVATAHERLHNDALDRQYGFNNLERSLYRRSGSAGGGSNTSPKR